MKKRSRYCALYTPAQTQRRVTQTLRHLADGEDDLFFYPCAELWSRSTRNKVIRPIMPGYVFIRSMMSAAEIHHIVRTDRWLLGVYLKELGLISQSSDGESLNEEDIEIEELSPEEAQFLDYILEVCCKVDNKASEEGKDICKSFLPDALFQMSYGYRENDGYVVMEGPLKGQESHITRVNVHDRKATLDYTIGGRKIRVGLETKPKRYWYPEDDTAPVVIEGDYEVDLEQMKRRMMSLKE